MLRDPNLIPLSHQHQHALGLCVLLARSAATDPGGNEAASQGRMIVDHFEAEMRGHFELEERFLFPALAGFPEVSTLVSELIAEHRRLTLLVDTCRSEPMRSAILEFTDLLRSHVRKEENVLFEAAQRLLSREQLEHIGNALAA
jgi:hemerythrin-like domain-containing protein